jgi:hypothetical protein
MALPATDTFTGVNGTALQTYSANWTIQCGAFAINTNAFYANASGAEGAAYWNADVFANNQYAQCAHAAEASTPHTGPAVRISTAASAGTTNDTYYGFYANSIDRQIFKNVAGTWTQFGSNGASPALNDVLRIEVEGTTIRCYVNGAGLVSNTDSAIASGAAGISGFDTGTGQRSDTWEGGNLAGAGAASLIPFRRPMMHMLMR